MPIINGSARVPETMIERMQIALRPFLHHGLAAEPDVEIEAVRAVLAAMREPTEAMKYAGLRADPTEQGLLPPVHAWPAMIDAVLAEDADA
jgi:hypothetical protein